MTLSLDIALQRGPLAVELQLRVAAGETLLLLGPNGAGKTTVLQAIAGLLRIDRGRIELGARTFDGGPAGPFVPPALRNVGVVFQDHVLFPHLSARDNAAFGPRSRGVARRAACALAAAWLERLGIPPSHHGARPAALSGGQAQRVALARALAASPDVLLLDEPLASVDASARTELRRELRRHLATFAGPRIAVVHDLADALALGDRIAVVENGRLVQQGSIRELVAQPRSRYVADLVGLNCFAGVLQDGRASIDGASMTVSSPLAGPVWLTLHPRAVALFRERPDGSPRNVWRAPVVAIEPLLERVRVQLGGALPIVAEVTPAAVEALALRPGVEVWVAVKATEIGISPR